MTSFTNAGAVIDFTFHGYDHGSPNYEEMDSVMAAQIDNSLNFFQQVVDVDYVHAHPAAELWITETVRNPNLNSNTKPITYHYH
jgi:hypothetical protein